jgi:hypothetical protein
VLSVEILQPNLQFLNQNITRFFIKKQSYIHPSVLISLTFIPDKPCGLMVTLHIVSVAL